MVQKNFIVEKLGYKNATSIVGKTVVALGTSLPELVTSIKAAKRGRAELALGNIFGSNIFNLLWVLGITTIINPLELNSSILFDLCILLGVNCFILVLLILPKRGELLMWQGYLLLLTYVGYLVAILI